MPELRRFSHSLIDTYLECPRKAYYRYVEGIESSKGDVSSALETMVSPTDAAGASVGGPTSSTSTSSASSSRTIHIAQLTIGDSPVAKQTFDDFRKMLLETFEGASLSIGGLAVGEGTPLMLATIAATVPPLPAIDNETLLVLLTGMLGLGGMRTFERVKGKA